MEGRAFLIVFFLFCLSSGTVRADTIPQRSICLRANYGFIIPHSKHIEPVSHTNPYGLEFTLNNFHCSPYSRRVFNAYWISGFQAAYFNFQNPDTLGGAYTFTLFAEPVLAFDRNFLVIIRGGTGISYNTRIYDENANPANQFFCTRINFHLYLSASIKYSLNDRFFLVVSGNYNHISNGGIKQPNYGMNFPTLSAGVEYFNTPYKMPEKGHRTNKRLPHKKMFYTFEVLSAFRVIDAKKLFPEKKTFALGLHARVTKPVGQIYSLNAGAELIFDGYFREQIERENIDADYKRFALTAGHDFKFGQMFFTQYFGFYVYSPLKPPAFVYQKYELAYKFKAGLMTGVFLKAHLQDAEMMGVTASWVISGK